MSCTALPSCSLYLFAHSFSKKTQTNKKGVIDGMFEKKIHSFCFLWHPLFLLSSSRKPDHLLSFSLSFSLSLFFSFSFLLFCSKKMADGVVLNQLKALCDLQCQNILSKITLMEQLFSQQPPVLDRLSVAKIKDIGQFFGQYFALLVRSATPPQAAGSPPHGGGADVEKARAVLGHKESTLDMKKLYMAKICLLALSEIRSAVSQLSAQVAECRNLATAYLLTTLLASLASLFSCHDPAELRVTLSSAGSSASFSSPS